jgi:TolA-binding protein
VRIPALFLSIALCFPATLQLEAQDPGAQQDAEAAREKLLKASDELDNIQANSEATKNSVDGMKTDVATLQNTVTQLQTDNAALKQQVADLQAAFDQYKQEQIKERETLIDNVAAMIAAGKSATKKKKAATPSPETEATPETSTPENSGPPPSTSSLAPPPDTSQGPADDTPPAPPKPQKGYYHVVASGETLTMICTAYRENGVHVTVSEIRKANGLTEDSVLKTGQKLFIPKPGT